MEKMTASNNTLEIEEELEMSKARKGAVKPVPKSNGRFRETAESLAAKQKDISVSEFFAKNRHLLGFDNPRKALLTADSRCSECRRWIELALRKHAKRRCHT